MIGLCLLTGRFLVLLRPLAAAGAMTLTLYSVHVVALTVAADLGRPLAAHPGPAWAANVLGAVLLALAWGAPRRRGPLERVAAGAASAARRPREQAPA